MLLTEYWSQGIMTEAARQMCEEAFEKLDIARITGIVYTENEASWKVLEKNGFVREGLQRKSACKNGKMHDIFLYGKLREDRTAISVDLMRRSDAYTIEHYVPSKELMYRAAYGVYLAYDSRRGEGAVSNGMHERNLMPDGWQGKRIAILTGGGNNGGDGYALAWILKEAGVDSVVVRVSDKLSEDGRYYCEKAEACGVTMRDFAKPEAGEADKRETAGSTDLSGYDVIVDCILGTGFKGEVRGITAEAIKAINESGAYVISVDINSGMNGDTGEAVLAVKSDLTVSIGYYKQGLFKGDADKYIKDMTNVDIGIILLEE
jgi:NAD(P)H-hydrate epimerase